MSTKPGATTAPPASRTRAAVPRTAPSAAMRPPRMPRSPGRAGAPVPSIRSPPRSRRSNCSATPPCSTPRGEPSQPRLYYRVPHVELPAARLVFDAGLALVLGREALALARVVCRAPIAPGGGVEGQVVGAARARAAVRPRLMRHPGVEHDQVARLGKERLEGEPCHGLGAHGAVGVLGQ